MLKILLGELKPDSGIVKTGTKQSIAYFDQQRAQLDPEKNLIDNVVDGSEMITFNGTSRHIISYLKDFLFEPERIRSPVKTLSGGETNRLLLAKLFTRSANILVLDEPTNDLDMETLELLEDILVQFDGTILIVSHDRDFLDNVVTGTWVFEGQGKISEYVGGYQDYIRYKEGLLKEEKSNRIVPTKEASQGQDNTKIQKSKNKLSFKDQRELDNLPQLIEKLEDEQKGLHEQMTSAEFYRLGIEDQKQKQNRLAEIDTELEQAYQRWEELDL